MVSVIANAIVLLVLWIRGKKSRPPQWFIGALAISDICFSITIHPMLIATSFGADVNELFTQRGMLAS